MHAAPSFRYASMRVYSLCMRLDSWQEDMSWVRPSTMITW